MPSKVPNPDSNLLPVMGLWIGDHLPASVRLSMVSFLAHGHQYRLYAYQKFDNIPSGVELRDANEILPKEHVYKIGWRGYSPFSDWFRWELLSREVGWWVDTDCVCLKPLDIAGELVVGMETGQSLEKLKEHVSALKPRRVFLDKTKRNNILINNAVIKCENPEHRVVRKLRQYCRKPAYLFMRKKFRWHKPQRALSKVLQGRAMMHHRLGLRLGGPIMLTKILIAMGACEDVKSREFFYPVHWSDREDLFNDKYADIENPFPNSYIVHWYDALGRKENTGNAFSKQSYFGQMLNHYSIAED